MSDAIWEAYAKQNKKKPSSNSSNRVSNSYGEVSKRVNKTNQEKAKEKKKKDKKTQAAVHKAIKTSDNRTALNTTTGTDTYRDKNAKNYGSPTVRYAYMTKATRKTAEDQIKTGTELAQRQTDMAVRRGVIQHKDAEEYKKDLLSDYGKNLKEYYKSDAGKKDLSKTAKDLYNKDTHYIKSERLTKDEFNANVTAQTAFGLAAKDLGTKYLTQRGKELGTEGDLAEKAGTRTAYSASKGKFATGVMQGMSYNDVLFSGAGKYNEEAQNAIKGVQDSGVYNLGYGFGQMGQVATSGVAGLTKAGIKTGEKVVAKQIAKSTGKKLAQSAGKAAAVESPFNAIDAAKMSRDETGKVDPVEAAKWMAFNTLLSGGTEAAINGIGVKVLAKNAKTLKKLEGAINAGVASKDEVAKYNKLKRKLTAIVEDPNSVGYKVADEGLNNTREGSKILSEEVNSGKSFKDIAKSKKQAKEAKDKLLKAGYNEDSALVKSLDDNIESLNTVRSNKETVKDVKKAIRSASDTKVTITKQIEKDLYDDISIVSTAIKTGDREAAKEIAEEAAKKYSSITGKKSAKAQAALAEEIYNSAEKNVAKHEGVNVEEAFRQRELTKDFTGDQDAIPIGHPNKSIAKRGENFKKAPAYEGEKPAQTATPREQTKIVKTELSEAKAAVEKAKAGKRNIKTELIDAYNKIADEMGLKDTYRVRDLSFGGDDYVINFVKKSIKETINKGDVTPEKLTVFKKIDEIIGNAKYIDSGENIHPEQSNIIRFDYFESNIKIDGEEYVVSFDVKVIPDTNNYYKHEINEIDLSKTVAGSDLEKSAGAVNESLSKDIKTKKPRNVKPEKSTGNKAVDDAALAWDDARKARDKAAKKFGKDSPEAKEAQKEFDKATKKLADEQNNARMKARETGEPAKPPTPEEESYDALMKQADSDDSYKTPMEKAQSHKTSKVTPNKPKPTNEAKEAWKSFRRLFESSLIEFEEVAKKTGNKELAAQINRTFRHGNITGSWIEGERRNLNGLKTGKGLDNIYGDAVKAGVDVDDLEIYALMKHDLSRRNAKLPEIFADMSEADVTKAIEEFETKYANGKPLKNNPLYKAQKELVEYNKDLLRYEVDSGIENAEQAKYLMDIYPDYVPTRRVEPQKNKATGIWDFVENDTMTVSTVNGKYKISSAGGEVESLYDQMVRKTQSTIKQGETNMLVRDYASALGIDPKNIKADIDIDSALNLPVPYSNGRTPMCSFFIDGQRYNMPVNHQVYMGLREFSGVQKAGFINAMGRISKVNTAFKNVVTNYNLLFGLRNGIRDTQQAIVNSRNGKGYFAAYPAGLRASVTDNAYTKLYNDLGGRYSTLVSQDAGYRGYEKFAKKNFSSTLKTGPKKALDMIERANSVIETIPRMTEFIATVQKDVNEQLAKKSISKEVFQQQIAKDLGIEFKATKGEIKSVKDMRRALEEVYEQAKNDTLKNRGLNFLDKDMRFDASMYTDAIEDAMADQIASRAGKATLDRAMYNASDITLNFNRSGVIGRGLNLGLVPYFNPSIQGLSKTVRMMSDDGIKGCANFMMKLGAFTAAPAVINELVLGDNEYYQSLNTRDKDNNFFIHLGDGKFLKIPKPRENAVIAEFAEYPFRWIFQTAQYGGPDSEWTDFFVNKEGGLRQMAKSAVDNIGPTNPITNNIASPVIRLALNKTWYGGDIESASDIDKIESGTPRSEIYDEKTSAVAIWLGQHGPLKDKLSPKKIDNVLDSYLGVIYDAGISQTSLQQQVQRDKYYNPLTTSFVLDALYSNKYAGTEWDKYNKGKDKNGKLTFDSAKLGNDYLYDASDSTNIIKQIYQDDSLSKSEKKEAINAVKSNQWGLYNASFNKKGYTKELDPMNAVVRLFGADKAYTEYASEQTKKQYEDYKKTDYYKGLNKQEKKQAQKDFHNYNKDIRVVNKNSGESPNFWSWTVVELMNQSTGTKTAKAVAEANGINKYTTAMVDSYLKAGKTIKDYEKSHIEIPKAFYDSQAYKDGKIDYPSQLDKPEKSVALANGKNDDAAYLIEDTYGEVLDRVNPARCVNEYNLKASELSDFAYSHNITLEKCKAGKITPEEFCEYLEEDYKDAPKEQKAGMFALYFEDVENPYGEIDDYSMDKDTGATIESGKGGKGKGGYKSYGHKKSIGSGRKGKKSKGTSGNGKTGYETTTSKTTDFKVHDNTKQSVLTEAYRKRKRKEMLASLGGK